ncbi:glycosyltransferase family A protein [Streptococcus cuniculipharyngis]|uniref:Glycosyltransferase family 2 protein n=1 Tax=Streptococcus cuniculipharyngis TaxID=1562651 RepID=A0A5C5SG20_9STRE|nr:glycosyltransferase family A protein [Streptococcus cuniculipharyngis]TWS98955.1 glycosyltransferase family 2 protein [Streptococcus cuniculipharyngis]
MKHTFVICAYGESPYLEECIQSLKAQTYSSRIICYSSTPNQLIKQACQTYDIPFYHKEGGGIGKDWNNALSFVETPYCTLAHQDDVYEKNYATKIMAAFEASPETTIAFSNYAEYREGVVMGSNLNLKIKSVMLAVMSWFPSSKAWRQLILAFGNPIACPAVSYHLKKLPGFQFSEELKVSLDWYAWYQISKHYQGRFSYVPEKLMYHRIHADSETTAMISDQTRTKEDLFMYELLWPKPLAKVLNGFYKWSQKSNH